MTLDEWTRVAQGIGIPIATAMLALAGVIWANEMKRRTDLRLARDVRMIAAIEELKEAARRASSNEAETDIGKLFEASWSFDFVVSSKRDVPVSKWFSMQVMRVGMLRGQPWAPSPRAMYAAQAVNETVNGLNDWRLGVKKPKWFAADAIRLEKLMEKPLVPTGVLTATAEVTSQPPGPNRETQQVRQRDPDLPTA